jgi:hypothetical protein
MIKVYKSYYGNLHKLDVSRCVGISQGVPSGFAGRIDRRMAPPWSLVKNASGYPEHEWKEKYFGCLDRNITPQQAAEVINGKIILCWERPGIMCHRHFLIEWLTLRGIEVDSEEWGDTQLRLL